MPYIFNPGYIGPNPPCCDPDCKEGQICNDKDCGPCSEQCKTCSPKMPTEPETKEC